MMFLMTRSGLARYRLSSPASQFLHMPAKGDVLQLTRTLANEWASHGISVKRDCPAYRVTDNTAALCADKTRNRHIMEHSSRGLESSLTILLEPPFFWHRRPDYVHGHVRWSMVAGWPDHRKIE